MVRNKLFQAGREPGWQVHKGDSIVTNVAKQERVIVILILIASYFFWAVRFSTPELCGKSWSKS